MLTENNYENSILLFSYLIVNVDGHLDIQEKDAVAKIFRYEKFPEEDLQRFVAEVPKYGERKIFNLGHEEILKCSDDQKVKVFAWLHRISEADGDVHIKEVRFLLYSIKKAGIEFDDVIKVSENLPSLI